MLLLAKCLSGPQQYIKPNYIWHIYIYTHQSFHCLHLDFTGLDLCFALWANLILHGIDSASCSIHSSEVLVYFDSFELFSYKISLFYKPFFCWLNWICWFLRCFFLLSTGDPHVQYSAVSSFVFLRFFAVAVLSPHSFQLRSHHPVSTRHPLSALMTSERCVA